MPPRPSPRPAARHRPRPAPRLLDAQILGFVRARRIPAAHAPWVALVIETAAHACGPDRALDWSRFDVNRFLLRWRRASPLPRRLSELQLLALASFFRWRAELGLLSEERAREVVWTLLDLDDERALANDDEAHAMTPHRRVAGER